MCIPLCTQADIGVSPIIVDIIGKETETEIAVKNFDIKNNAYVEITPYRLFNPASHDAPNKKRVLHPDQDGLLIFPAKLTLLPGQTQFVRVIKTAKLVKSDQVYEVDFIPKVSTHLINQKHPSGMIMGIRVIIGYGARVTLRPDHPSPALFVKRLKNKLVIKNTGNTLLNITSCTQSIDNKKSEIPLPSYTLFAGQTIKKELAHVTPIALNASFIDKPLDVLYTD
jgi:P pilus assembly chaperone PapD